MKIRLQKYIAEKGIASRRQAEKMIEQGKVSVNGQKIFIQGVKVDPEKDTVQIGRQTFSPATASDEDKKIYYMLNKPKGYVCTNRRFKGEKNIFSLVPTKMKLFCVGRLDKDSEGLLLLTNDGALNQKLTHPKYKSEKEYEVTVTTPLRQHDLVDMCGGLKIEDDILKMKKFKIVKPKICKIVLTEGKKRQIRKLFAKKRYHITSLIRVRMKNLPLGKLKTGEIRELRSSDIKKLI